MKKYIFNVIFVFICFISNGQVSNYLVPLAKLGIELSNSIQEDRAKEKIERDNYLLRRQRFLFNTWLLSQENLFSPTIHGVSYFNKFTNKTECMDVMTRENPLDGCTIENPIISVKYNMLDSLKRGNFRSFLFALSGHSAELRGRNSLKSGFPGATQYRDTMANSIKHVNYSITHRYFFSAIGGSFSIRTDHNLSEPIIYNNAKSYKKKAIHLDKVDIRELYAMALFHLFDNGPIYKNKENEYPDIIALNEKMKKRYMDAELYPDVNIGAEYMKILTNRAEASDDYKAYAFIFIGIDNKWNGIKNDNSDLLKESIRNLLTAYNLSLHESDEFLLKYERKMMRLAIICELGDACLHLGDLDTKNRLNYYDIAIKKYLECMSGECKREDVIL